MFQITFYLLWFLKLISGANILFFSVVPSISHQIFFQPICKELSLRGHNLTIITPNPSYDTNLSNYTELDSSYTYNISSQFAEIVPMDNPVLINVIHFYHCFCKIVEAIFNDGSIMHTVKNTKFDLIIIEAITPLAYGIAAQGIPVIGINSFTGMIPTHDDVDNPTHPILAPDYLLNMGGKLSFYDRLYSSFYSICYRIYYYLIELPNCDKIARKYFGNNIPYLGDVISNMSLAIVNANPVMNYIRPTVPTMIEVSQIHIKPKRPLTKDIKIFMDNSKNGVIYCSLGTNVPCSNQSDKLTRKLMKVFEKLPYDVIWKCNTEFSIANRNVLVRKWLPQQDILGHPKLKAFVTQGGVQSIEEAILNGVPMIGLPIYADQPYNIKKIVYEGICLSADFQTVTVEELIILVREIAENKLYKSAVLQKRKILLDQPMSGLNKAIWWIEYVIRHKGAGHLRNPAAKLPLYKYYLIDVISFMLVIFIIVVYLVKKLVITIKNSLNSKVKVKIN